MVYQICISGEEEVGKLKHNKLQTCAINLKAYGGINCFLSRKKQFALEI